MQELRDELEDFSRGPGLQPLILRPGVRLPPPPESIAPRLCDFARFSLEAHTLFALW